MTPPPFRLEVREERPQTSSPWPLARLSQSACESPARCRTRRGGGSALAMLRCLEPDRARKSQALVLRGGQRLHVAVATQLAQALLRAAEGARDPPQGRLSRELAARGFVPALPPPLRRARVLAAPWSFRIRWRGHPGGEPRDRILRRHNDVRRRLPPSGRAPLDARPPVPDDDAIAKDDPARHDLLRRYRCQPHPAVGVGPAGRAD